MRSAVDLQMISIFIFKMLKIIKILIKFKDFLLFINLQYVSFNLQKIRHFRLKNKCLYVIYK